MDPEVAASPGASARMPDHAARWLYPALLGGAVLATGLAIEVGAPPTAVTGITVGILALAIGALELVLPHEASWRPAARSFGVDLAHTFITAYAVAPAIRATVLVALAGFASRWVHAHGAPIWPQGWPMAAQLALAIAIADLGAYGAHRFMHATRLGWRLHAVHHSPQRLNFLASARSHPFNVLLTHGLETGPLVLLGIGPEAFALWTIVKAVNGLLQHSNLALDPGPLSRVLATTEVHRWHHSIHMDESNTNFGNTTVVWDRLFGTYFLPEGRHPGTTVGIADQPIPERYLAHLVAPFLLARWERAVLNPSVAPAEPRSPLA